MGGKIKWLSILTNLYFLTTMTNQSKVFGKAKGQTVEEYMATLESVKRWLTGLRHGQATSGTKFAFSWALFQYCKHVGRDPDTLLKEREREIVSKNTKTRERADDDLREFFETYKGNSTKQMIGGAVRSFYSYHRKPLAKSGR